MKIVFIGGDNRTVTAFNELKGSYDVDSLGLFSDDSGDITTADVIVLPVPTTRDGVTVNCALTSRKILLSSINNLPRGCHIITYGYIFNHYPQTDYSRLDGFCIKNAVLTAEGAIAHAISSTDFSLFGSKILVIGFGRVGKVLAERLSGFKANITVTARKSADAEFINSMGLNFAETANAANIAENYDIIFNTVDIPLNIDLMRLKSTCLFDLSSKGCVDFEAAQKLGIKAYKLPSIPGKTAPVTAGKIIAQTVDGILKTSQKY